MLLEAKPIIWSYLITGSPLFIGFKQILWPKGMLSKLTMPWLSILVLGEISKDVTATLSFLFRMIRFA